MTTPEGRRRAPRIGLLVGGVMCLGMAAFPETVFAQIDTQTDAGAFDSTLR